MKNRILKRHLIFTNDPCDFSEDEMKEFWAEEHWNQTSEEPQEEPTQEQLWEAWYTQIELDWDSIRSECKYHEESGTYLVVGTLGLWNGLYAGGKIIHDRLDKVIQYCFEDYNQVYMEGKNLKISATHHDGTNNFIIKKLTPKGEKYADRHSWDMTDQELHQKLFKDSHYSHCVDFFAKIYGWG